MAEIVRNIINKNIWVQSNYGNNQEADPIPFHDCEYVVNYFSYALNFKGELFCCKNSYKDVKCDIDIAGDTITGSCNQMSINITLDKHTTIGVMPLGDLVLFNCHVEIKEKLSNTHIIASQETVTINPNRKRGYDHMQTCNILYCFLSYSIHSINNENITFEKKEVIDTCGWSSETVLSKLGYTVSKQVNLCDEERQKIICDVITSKKLSKIALKRHLELMINLRKKNGIYAEAIEKWTKDIEYIDKNF